MHLVRILLSCLVAAACPGLAHADASCSQFFPAGQPPALINQKLAVRTTLLCNDAYASLASGVTHGPLWSAEHPTAASLAEAAQTHREGRFHADDRLPQPDQAQLTDYRRSGFDRGHMTPSGDMPGETAQQQSFSLANMVPQTAALNQGIWAGIEGAVRGFANRDGELYLVTGPAFHSAELKSIGPDGVLVPTSTWKAVYDPRIQGAGVYVCKNTDTPTCDIVSVATLIRVVGIDPFPALPDRLKQVVMALPQPEASRYGHRDRRQPPALDHSPLQPLIDWLRRLLSA